MTTTDHPRVTPEMIAAGADVLEHVHNIGRWLAESLASSVLEAAFEAQDRALRAGSHTFVLPTWVQGFDPATGGFK